MIIKFDIKFTRKTINSTPPKYYLNYYNVRNNAWDFLIKNKVTSFPLNLQALANNNNWLILSYKQFCKLYNLNENDFVKKYPDGFTAETKDNQSYIICYNQNNVKQRNRFTICHEIGHIILHAIYKNEKLEKEANMFAARILMPMLLIKELKITTAEELAKLCDVSLEAATNRLIRFKKEIKKRSMFYTNPREQQLYKQLKDFITKSKNT